MPRTKKNASENIEAVNSETSEVEVAEDKETIVATPITPTKKSKATIDKELRAKSKDLDVEIESLFNGKIFLRNKKTQEIVELEEYGDKVVTSLANVIDLRNQCRDIFNLQHIIISDIYSDEYTVDNVLGLLNLKYTKTYIGATNIDKFIEDSEFSEFETKFNGMRDEQLKNRIVERAIYLAKEKRLDSTGKRTVIKQYVNKDYLFDNI